MLLILFSNTYNINNKYNKSYDNNSSGDNLRNLNKYPGKWFFSQLNKFIND